MIKKDIALTNEMSTSIPKGLLYYPRTLSSEFIQVLKNEIDSYPWSNELKRRTQQYGYKYSYGSRVIAQRCDPMPPNIQLLSSKTCEIISDLKISLEKQVLNNQNLTDFKNLGNLEVQHQILNQCIVNEYTKGQGIGAHTDAKIFGPFIISYSLGDNVIMKFTKSNEQYNLLLEEGSLLIMHDEARNSWKHEISPSSTKYHDSRDSDNYRRISITYREVLNV
jgi:alkylated DNA repair dioxygenase AlkB